MGETGGGMGGRGSKDTRYVQDLKGEERSHRDEAARRVADGLTFTLIATGSDVVQVLLKLHLNRQDVVRDDQTQGGCTGTCSRASHENTVTIARFTCLRKYWNIGAWLAKSCT